MTSDCRRCEGMRAWYRERFARELREAREEVRRLGELFKEVCWYNFETRARTWTRPWYLSDPESFVSLGSMAYTQKWSRGHLVEYSRFGTYYSGPVKDAPILPPEVILTELKAAKEHEALCARNLHDPDDYAPGGIAYQMLLQTTQVPVRGISERRCVFIPWKRKLSDASDEEDGGAAVG